MKKSLHTAALLASLALAACGEPKPPCTDCPNVAGRYLAEAEELPAESSSCGELMFEAMSLEIEVAQEAANLKTTDFFGVEGTLHDDLSATFYGVNVLTGANTQMQMQLVGAFEGDEGARTLNGRMDFSTFDGCTLQVPVTWTQIGEK